ncbi:hypothetical protein PINS_up014184 [Pythium insidiosum]|nr:hypothetical protein PINS_up014184 [Pythium insidiosum]
MRRRPSARDAASRIGEILSDSDSELSSLEDNDKQELPTRAAASAAAASSARRAATDDDDEEQEEEEDKEEDEDGEELQPTHSSNNPPAAARPTTMRRKNSKWYDSDGDDAAPAAAAPPPEAPTKSVAAPPAKRSSLQRLVEKTKTFSPFAAKRKQLDGGGGVLSPSSSRPDTPKGTERSSPAPARTVAAPVNSQAQAVAVSSNSAAAHVWSPHSDASSVHQEAAGATSDRRLSRLRSPMADAVSPASAVLSDQSDLALSPQTTTVAFSAAAAAAAASTTAQSGGWRSSPRVGATTRRQQSPAQAQPPGAVPAERL